jgi:hypothetical protein
MLILVCIIIWEILSVNWRYLISFQTEIIEKHIETHLAKQIPNFSMDRFIEHLQ